MFLLLFISKAIALWCTSYNENYIKLVGNNNEYLRFAIGQAFPKFKDYDHFELIDPNNKLQLEQHIQLLGSGIVDETEQNYKIIKFDGVQKKDRYWPNQYGILRIVNNQYQLIYNLQQWYSNQDRMPKFDKSIDIGSTDEIVCYDFVWITSKSVIIDCMDTINEEEINYFYIFQIGDQIIKKQIPNDYPYSKNQERKLYIQSKYLYRVTKKNQYNNQNQVEIFQYNSETLQFTKFAAINSQFFVDNDFTLIYTDYQNFEILDFKCSDTYQFSFLDQLQNIVFLQHNNNEWKLEVQWCKYKIHSYDIDFMSKKYIGVGQSFQYDSSDPYFLLKLPFDSSNYTSYLVDKYTNLASSEALIQTIYGDISSTMVGDFSQVLVDSKNNEIFSIQGNRILRFTNRRFVQLIYHPTDEADLNIYKAQVIYQGCTLNIEYQTIASDSWELIQVQKNEFMFWFVFFATPNTEINYLDEIVSGPNISFVVLDEQDKILDNFQQIKSYNGAVDIQFNSNNVFLEIVTISQKMIVISQDDKLKLTFQVCLIELNQCSILLQTQLDFQLTKENTCISTEMGYISISTLISSEKLSYIIYQKPDYFKKEIFTLDKEQEIDIMAYITFALVLSSSKQQVVYVYSLDLEMKLLYSFSSKDYEFIKPDKLFYQQYTNQNSLLFLFNKQDQLLVILYLDLSLHYVIDQIQLIDAENIKVLRGNNGFVVAQKNKNGKHEILIYDMGSYSNIFLRKQLPLYSYDMENLLENIVIGNLYGVVFVKCQNMVLMYDLSNPRHESLLREFSIDKDVKEIFVTQNCFVYLQKQKLMAVCSNGEPKFNYKINLNNDIFVQYNHTQVSCSNDKSKLNIKQKFKYVNKNTKIEVYPEKLNIVTKLDEAEQDNFVQDMGSDWYSGQVVRFQLLNDDSNNNIQIIQQIKETKNTFYKGSKAIRHFDDTTFFVLNDQTYSLIDKANGDLIKEFTFLDKDYQCKSILYAQDQNFIVSCSQGTQEMVFGISCENQDCQSSKGLPIVYALNNAFIFENNLFLTDYYSIFAWGIQASLLNLEEAKYFGAIFFDRQEFSNKIVIIKHNHFHLYSFKNKYEFIIKEFRIKDEKLSIFNEFSIDMNEFLNKEYSLGGDLLEIEVLSTSLVDELFQGKFLFFARDGAHYGINYNFTCKDLRCELKDQEVFAVIQGYDDYSLLERSTEKDTPTISLQNDLLLIFYCYWRNDQKILAAYRLPSNNEKNVPILFFGALEFSNNYYRIEKQLISYELNNKEYFLFNSYDYTTLTRYEVNLSPKIVYNGTMKSEVLDISVENHYNSQLLSLNIEVEAEDPEEESHMLLYVAAGTGGLVGIGIIAYICKKLKIVDTLL